MLELEYKLNRHGKPPASETGGKFLLFDQIVKTQERVDGVYVFATFYDAMFYQHISILLLRN